MVATPLTQVRLAVEGEGRLTALPEIAQGQKAI